jgi:hypothetical protein
MQKTVLAVVTAAAVAVAALVPSGPSVQAATEATEGTASSPPGFGSALSSVQQPAWQTNASVNAVAVAGNLVFAGGLFTRVRPPGKARGVDDAPRKYFAVLNRTTGAPTRFAPQVNGPVWSVATDGKRVVIGGDFTVVDGVPRSRIAMFDIASGKLVAGWDPAVSYRVAALKIAGNIVYLGGSFGSVDKVARGRIAAVSLSTGALLPWNPGADDDVHAIEVSTDHQRVFVGGGFVEIGGRSSHSLAMLSAATGAAYDLPAARAIPMLTPQCDSRVKDLEVQGNKVFAANAGAGIGCYDGVLAADATTGKLIWQSHCLGATEAIKAIGNWLYKGSHAHDCSADGAFPDKTGMHHLLVYSAITGKLGPWFPNVKAGGKTLVGPLSFASGGNDLWAGGDFTEVNGVPQEGLTRFTNAPGGAAPAQPAAPKVASARPNKVTIAFETVLDRDNLKLTYLLYRGATRIGTWSRSSNSWTKPTVTSVTDSGLTSGQTVSYHLEVSDGRNVRKSPTVSVRVR